ncbi:hypothetical protein BEWA_047760 [Theileria equi strain WA]|uniref:Uncharacterized protein n=1 Tax=Theileria equi strain WA TaxID=1537102 RepID=L1LAH6_THEEQ|nr:hypothetical protein BEWA_047760 [Theileria equi strain WA]EKX72311.1 hypothetical protein BEWA_047760 [Theileria equi strain WA]|eukprot:XP_004831763.1 hypothetical protein BEWA_047760 [Theileria equi strain WA]
MSNGGVNLDLSPDKITSPGDDIAGSSDEVTYKPYVMYKYDATKPPFQLKSLTYKGQTLEGFAGITQISNLYTYFTKNNSFLCLQIKQKDDRNTYYTTKNAAKSADENTTFDKFIVSDKGKKEVKELSPDQTKTLLQNIEVNNQLDYDTLDAYIKEYLWRQNDIYFNLKNEQNRDLIETYDSEVTNIKVTVEKGKTINKNFLEVKHVSKGFSDSFYIKGFRDAGGNIVIVKGGFPNDIIKEFIVYYRDGDYINPLLVVLTLKDISDNDKSFVNGSYILSNTITYHWDILRISETDIEDKRLGEVLQKIDENRKVTLFKPETELRKRFQDITKDLLINLTGDFQEEKGKYDSDGKKIPYKKTKVSAGYTSIFHGYGFISFTISKIATNYGSISQDILPQNGTRVSRLKVYYNGTVSTDDPLLIYFLQSDGTKKWICRHLGDKQWVELERGAPTSDVDSSKIKTLLDKLSTPKIIIDVSKTGGQYQPDGNTLQFTVDKSVVNGSQDYYGFKHTESGNKGFMIKEVIHKGDTLSGITSDGELGRKLESITAYYDGDSPTDPTKLLLVELVSRNNERYFYRKTKGASTWSNYPGPEGTGKLTDLKELLDRLKEDDFPGLSTPESEEDSQNSTGAEDSNQESSPTSTSQSSISPGAVIGGLLGGIACLCIVGALIWKLKPTVGIYVVNKIRRV